MPSLFDILAQAQNGNGMQALAQQFGLSMQQTQSAVEALLPAFSQGLRRNTADPYGLGAFMTAMASGQHAKYFEDATRAFSPQGVDEGNGILGHLFGSKDLSRAVASQGSTAAGSGSLSGISSCSRAVPNSPGPVISRSASRWCPARAARARPSSVRCCSGSAARRPPTSASS